MKFLKIFIAVAAISMGTAKAQLNKAELQVSGLTCSMCSKATEKSLRTLDFISNITTDLNKNTYVITFKKNTPVNFENLGKKVQGAGFSVNTLKAYFDFNNIKTVNGVFNFGGANFHLVNGGDQPLSGQVALTFVDKGLAPASLVKKYSGHKPDLGDGKKVYCVEI